MSSASPEISRVLDLWLERDLSAVAHGAPSIYEMDAEFEQATAILASGRNLLLVGESGVGKSALVGELARHIPTLAPLSALRAARVLEFSVGLRMSRLRKDESIFEAFSALMDAIAGLEHPVVSYFRDGDMLYQSGIAAQLDSFCMRQRCPVIVEGRPTAMNEMLELYESIEHHFVTLTVREPDVDRAVSIVSGWAKDPLSPGRHSFDESALSEAVYLTHRFLARSRLPRKAMDLLRDTQASTSATTIDCSEVIARFCMVHHTPRWLVDPHQTLALDALEERIREALLGQDDAVNAAVSTIALVKSGLCDLRRPFGMFLFVGPTGVGKTHLAQILATELFGSPQRMVRINLGDFANPHDAQSLFGDSEHHLVANRRGVLTQRLIGHPFGVVLLDEFEKAHASVHDRLLPLIDEGCFTNGAGELISCRSSIIIATSNAGAEVYRESALGFTTPSDLGSKRDELERRLHEIFRFELLNRFDRIIHFHPLAREEIRKLAARELQKLEQRPGLRRHRIQLDVDEAVLDWLAAHGYNAQFGARFLKRTVERTATTAIADLIARHPPEQAARIELDVHRGQIRARTPGEQSKPPMSARGQRRVVAPTAGLDGAALMERALSRMAALERDAGERDQLLIEMSHSEFWDDSQRRDVVTERFRHLDVSTRLIQRFARPLLALREAIDRDAIITQAALDAAALALSDWEERDLHEGHSALWLVLSNIGNEAPPRHQMMRLANMYMAWCRRNELRCVPVAFEPRGADLFSRLALDIHGPGAEFFLDSERGVHRLRRKNAPPMLIRVDVVAQQCDGFGADVRDRALVRGPFALMAQLQASVALAHTGQNVTFVGESRASLASLAGDLLAAWAGLRTDSPEIVRKYGEPGGLVLDPRTGATTPRSAVEHGRLEAFHEAFSRGMLPPQVEA
jgi:ATP-dependent Clp protease ATP-binding subunit ClpC